MWFAAPPFGKILANTASSELRRALRPAVFQVPCVSLLGRAAPEPRFPHVFLWTLGLYSPRHRHVNLYEHPIHMIQKNASQICRHVVDSHKSWMIQKHKEDSRSDTHTCAHALVFLKIGFPVPHQRSPLCDLFCACKKND